MSACPPSIANTGWFSDPFVKKCTVALSCHRLLVEEVVAKDGTGEVLQQYACEEQKVTTRRCAHVIDTVLPASVTYLAYSRRYGRMSIGTKPSAAR